MIALWRPVSVWDIDARRPVDPGTARVRLSFDASAARPRRVAAQRLGAAGAAARDATDLGLSLGGDLVLVSVR